MLLVYLIYSAWPPAPFGQIEIGDAATSTAPIASAGDGQSDAQEITGDGPSSASEESKIHLFGGAVTLSNVQRILIIVMAVAALGSFIHVARSFVAFVGLRRMYRSWLWWYLLRPLIGVAMATLFYFVLRGGLLSASTSAEDISLFGIAAVSGLVGLFSRQAGDKLEELFNTLFRTDRAREEGDGLANPLPIITVIEPVSLLVATDAYIVVRGGDFVEDSVVRVDGRPLETSHLTENRLTAIVPESTIPLAGEIPVTVVSPPPGGGTSDPSPLALRNPVPEIARIDPTSVPAGSDVDMVDITRLRQ